MRTRPLLFVLGVLGIASLACGVGRGPTPQEDPPAPTPLLPASQQAAGPAAVQEAHGEVVNLYLDLRSKGCHPEAAGIDSALVARVLRNVPYALAGHRFHSPELETLFRADLGAEYASSEELGLDAPDLACVGKLKAHEDRLRRVQCIDPASEAALLSNHRAFLWHARQGMSGLFETGSHPEHKIPVDPGFDACRGEKGRFEDEWSVVRYHFEIAPVEDERGVEPALDVASKYGAEPYSGNILDPQASERIRARLKQAFSEGTPVLSFYAQAAGVDHLGDTGEAFEGVDELRCVGLGPDFMDTGWLCAGISIP